MMITELPAVDLREPKFDLFIATLGYEERSSSILGHVTSERGVALGFPHNHELSFAANRKRFAECGYEEVVVEDEQAESIVRDRLRDLVEGRRNGAALRVGIDISSMTRRRMAFVLSAAIEAVTQFDLQVDLLYQLAEFSSPLRDEASNVHIGPVVPELAGWFDRPDLPLSLILGVGFEVGAALGAREFLDPDHLWIFEPESITAQYADAVREANLDLWAVATGQAEVFRYSIFRPLEIVGVLQNLVDKVLERSRVVLLPFGPKIFSAACILTGLQRSGVSVWRVSTGPLASPTERIGSGKLVGLRLQRQTVRSADSDVGFRPDKSW